MKFATNASNPSASGRTYRVKMSQELEKKFKSENRYCEIETILLIGLSRSARNQQAIIMYELSSRHTSDKANEISAPKNGAKFDIGGSCPDMRHLNATFG